MGTTIIPSSPWMRSGYYRWWVRDNAKGAALHELTERTIEAYGNSSPSPMVAHSSCKHLSTSLTWIPAGRGPSLNGRYSASTLLRPSPTPDRAGGEAMHSHRTLGGTLPAHRNCPVLKPLSLRLAQSAFIPRREWRPPQCWPASTNSLERRHTSAAAPIALISAPPSPLSRRTAP
jgi:hypothetical protein